jgi:hypothetical protein
MVFDAPRASEEAAPPESPAQLTRKLLFVTVVAAAVSALFAAVWWLTPHAALFESPYVWTSLIAFWFLVFNAIYGLEIRALERTIEGRTGLEVEGVRMIWLPRPDLGSGQASVEVHVRSKARDFPAQFTLFLNLNLTWSFYVVGLRARWECNESGVLLLAHRRTRFLGGATAESLSLPSPEVASLRGLIHPGAETAELPDWGRTPGARAADALEKLQLTTWLIGPEQPFVAFDASEGGIEKWWPPIIDRVAALDTEGALDILLVVRAFDLDILEERGRRLTSSPSSHRP